ncbi:MAG: hypothetical protein CM1200mP30_12850 [Pseudomonadota bacterium]|nr:MAG: hypothetical protein CM1200mP30_12850 [Pseudomonadota bacterium]
MKQRLDRLLVEQNLAPSRERAQAFIMAGKVRVDGQPAGKSGRLTSRESHLEVLGHGPALCEPRWYKTPVCT